MRIRERALAIAAAMLLPLAGLTVMPAAAAPAAAATTTSQPARELRMSTTGVCPSGTVLVPRASARRAYRHAHRFAVQRHLSRKQQRRLVLCTPVSAAPPASPASPSPAPSSTTAPVADWQADMLARVNALRASVGAGPVALCAPLTLVAQGYADEMARTGVLAHEGPDGTEPWDRMRAAGYQWSRASENLARGHGDVAAVMAGWTASPGHHANLVDPNVHDVGLGLAVDAAGTHWWVQDFGAGGSC